MCGLIALLCTGASALSSAWPWEFLSAVDLTLARLADLVNMPLPSGTGYRTIEVKRMLLDSSLTQVR